MNFSKHDDGICWKILAIMWCDKNTKMASAGEPVFVLWSEHITEWTNCEATELTYVYVTYPRWKFVRESRIKAIMTTEIVELSDEQRKIKNLALRGFVPDPMDPTAPEKEAQLKKARQKELDDTRKSTSPVVAKGPSTNPLKRNAEPAPKGKSAKRSKKDSTAPLGKEDKVQLTELEQKLCDSEELLQSQSARIMRLEGKQDLQKKSYDELRRKVPKSWRAMPTCEACSSRPSTTF